MVVRKVISKTRRKCVELYVFALLQRERRKRECKCSCLLGSTSSYVYICIVLQILIGKRESFLCAFIYNRMGLRALQIYSNNNVCAVSGMNYFACIAHMCRIQRTGSMRSSFLDTHTHDRTPLLPNIHTVQTSFRASLVSMSNYYYFSGKVMRLRMGYAQPTQHSLDSFSTDVRVLTRFPTRGKMRSLFLPQNQLKSID